MGLAGEKRLYSFISKFNPEMEVSFSARRGSGFFNYIEKNMTLKNLVNKIW